MAGAVAAAPQQHRGLQAMEGHQSTVEEAEAAVVSRVLLALVARLRMAALAELVHLAPMRHLQGQCLVVAAAAPIQAIQAQAAKVTRGSQYYDLLPKPPSRSIRKPRTVAPSW